MAFISFDEFSDAIDRGSDIILIVMTADCDDAAERLGSQVRRIVGRSATVHQMCADGTVSPTIVYYQGGDTRPILTREGPEALRSVSEDLAEARRLSTTRPTPAEEATQQHDALERTERMLASERLDHFPPFFQMARTLARDAWYAARRSAEGAPLLLRSDAAAARLAVCQACPSLRGDRCLECGCYVTVKAHVATMRCPLAKWPDAS